MEDSISSAGLFPHIIETSNHVCGLLHTGARSDDGQMQFLVHLIIASFSHEVDMVETHAVVDESEKNETSGG
jgi:hypothetical protein